MSGHSKWAQIKHKKAHTDKKRGKVFTKIVKEIAVAARLGGGDPEGNPRLRLAIDKAKEVNMPSENVKRAIMKGTGELPGTNYEETTYEGYGPSGVAIFMDVMTDNRNRTVSELRNILSKAGGSLGENGCVAWMFSKVGLILVEKSSIAEDKLMDIALESGAKDMKNDPDEETYEIIAEPEDFEAVKKAITDAGISMSFAEITRLPQNYVTIEGKTVDQMERLMENLEDHDDIQEVYSNYETKG